MNRLLLAIDQFDSGQVALVFGRSCARGWCRSHGAACARTSRAPAGALPGEPDRCAALVDEAVFCLRQAGISGDARMRSARADHVARWIVYESHESRCDAIVLGSRRLRGIERASGRGVRERVIRSTQLPVLVAPATPINKVHRPYAFESPSLNRP